MEFVFCSRRGHRRWGPAVKCFILTSSSPPGSSTDGSNSVVIPIWAYVLIAIGAFAAGATVIIGSVCLYKRLGGSRGTSANNDITKQPSSYYENYRRPLPAITNGLPESGSPYMDLKYSTSSVYEDLQ
ncbi:cell adhesion molecule CEACAM19 isoform X2 [Microcaecilia unicolor]|uniref:Uncharacterized protein LOC115476107 isoform X2 n=1 Tax=Microcaecilia unicolor TaxID=1415580 RepID=A0A6P7YXE3_9AMPH|nr:uncharacterized protein LOC115476107 isoform X2 [Microcaecilia unicolor]